MSFKKSCSNVQRNKNIWASNLTSYQDSVEIIHWNNFQLQKVENSTPSRSYRSLQVSWNRNEKQK